MRRRKLMYMAPIWIVSLWIIAQSLRAFHHVPFLTSRLHLQLCQLLTNRHGRIMTACSCTIAHAFLQFQSMHSIDLTIIIFKCSETCLERPLPWKGHAFLAESCSTDLLWETTSWKTICAWHKVWHFRVTCFDISNTVQSCFEGPHIPGR